MFNEIIRSTPFTTAAADNIFSRIGGAMYRGDCTFVSTLRALVYPRLPKDTNEILIFNYNSASVITSNPFDERYKEFDLISRAADNTFDYSNTLTLVDLAMRDPSSNDAWSRYIEEKFTVFNPSYTRVEKVTQFYQKVFKVYCFIDPAKKSTVLITIGLDTAKYHYLQCGIFAYLPWYFDPDKKVSDDEMNLIKSLRERYSGPYIDALSKFSDALDLRALSIRNMLDGFEASIERVEIERHSNAIATIIEQINDLHERVADLITRKREEETFLMGLQTKLAECCGESEIMEYFLHNKYLTLDNVDNGVMTFVVRSYLEYFNEDAVERIIENDSSIFYAPNNRLCDHIIPHDDMKRLLKAVFLDGTVKIRLCAAYRFSLRGEVRALSNYAYSDCDGYIPNPHINHFACIGDYQRYIDEFLSNRDYISAINQCVASCKSINVNEFPTISHFAMDIYGLNMSKMPRCFEMPDGRVLTAKDAAAELANR